MTTHHSSTEPIAIVGMACRLPGGIENPSDLWNFLMEEKSAYSDFPAHKLKIDSWYHPNATRPGSMVSRGGCFLQRDTNEFDHSFFGISAVEASSMDPSQKQLLEVVYEAFESAGVTLTDLASSKTGVYVGNFGTDHATNTLKDDEYLKTYTSTGTGSSILSNRISYVFDLLGPSFTLDTACSSSIYALHLACSGIRNGDCLSAIVAAPNAIDGVEAHLVSSKLGALSPSSQCHTFDASADGYARAEGFTAIYIMKLSDALTSGRPIRAVVRATSIGANGRGGGMTHPESVGQAAVIRKAYEAANIHDFSQTGYFECHGTGTPVGDPIETGAIGNVFAPSRTNDQPLLIGSVKPSVGHGEGSAGLTALIKTVLAIENKIIPPTIGLVNPNPAINFDEWRLKVVTKATPWPAHIPLCRASVNSFGFGGANAHAIVEGLDSVLSSLYNLNPKTSIPEHSEPNSPPRSSAVASDDGHAPLSSGQVSPPTEVSFQQEHRTPKIILCSARNALSLSNTVDIIKRAPEKWRMEDIAFTLGKREKFSHRAVAVSGSSKALEFRTEEAQKAPQLAFIFTGQGAQWPGMGLELFLFPTFLRSIREIDSSLSLLDGAPDFTVEGTLKADLKAHEMNEPRVSQLVCTALQIAILDLLTSWGIEPVAVAGHSAGEIAAAYAAGYLTKSEAVAVAYYRGHAVSEMKGQDGSMLAVGLSREESQKLLPPDGSVVIGAINSPKSVTLSGDTSSIKKIKESLDKQSIFNRLLPTAGRAYHSQHMESAATAYAIPLSQIKRAGSRPKLQCRYFSTVTGELWLKDEIPMSYWRQNMESPVLFSDAISAMHESGMTYAFEIGPHSTLRSPILDVIKSAKSSSTFSYSSSLRRNTNAMYSMLNACGDLLLRGCEANLDRINGNGAFLPDLPGYQWDHSTTLRSDNRLSKENLHRKFPRHDLLGSLLPGLALDTKIWRNILSTDYIPWLAHHRIGSSVVFPATGYIAMALEAMNQVRESNCKAFMIEGINFGAALNVDEEVEVFLTMRKQALGRTTVSKVWWEFCITSVKDGSSTEHSRGRVAAVEESEDSHYSKLSPTEMSRAESISHSRCYDEITATAGLHFGPAFRRVSNVLVDSEQGRGRADLNLSIGEELTEMKHESSYVIHPTVLDCCFQSILLAVAKTQSTYSYLPVSVDKLVVLEDRANSQLGSLESYAQSVGFKTVHGGMELLNSEGKLEVFAEGLKCSGAQTFAGAGGMKKREAFWTMVWEEDCDAITESSAELYFPQDKFFPEQYKISRRDQVYLALLMIRQFSQAYPHLLGDIAPATYETGQFMDWLRSELENMKENYPIMYNASLEDRGQEIEKARQVALKGSEWTWAIYDNLHKIIGGEISALDLAAEGDLLANFYATQIAYNKFQRFVELLGFKHPNMKILEIGAGTGSATQYVLDALTGGGTKRYSGYTYTDVSSSFFDHASSRFEGYEDLEFKVYNMEEDPAAQGMELGAYDLVIASCAVHVTANITTVLKEIRKLLKPGGRLLLFEITLGWADLNLHVGLLPGFYKANEETGHRHPFRTIAQWKEAFPNSDFEPEALVLTDLPEEHTFTVLYTTAASEPKQLKEQPARSQVLTVVYWDRPTELSGAIEALATQRGLSVQHRPFLRSNPEQISENEEKSRLIVVVELERLIWTSIDSATWIEFLHMVNTAESILWVTQEGLLDGGNPEAVMVNGFFQSLDIGPQTKVASMDFEKAYPRDQTMAEWILYFENLLPTTCDKQVRQSGGKWLISRLVPDQGLSDDYARSTGVEESPVILPLKDVGPVEIWTNDPGRLSALVFREDDSFKEPLLPDSVEVKVKAVGMNMVELSILTGGYDIDTKNCEFAGVITQIGQDVTDLAIGDRVFGLCPGRFGNFVRVPAFTCQKGLDSHSFEELATLPSAYGTAYYAMVMAGRIQAGETLLIQSATGGFGMAAIALGQLFGADIYVTAGSETKRELLGSMGIKPDHIFSSRDVSQYSKLKAATGGQGFDVVLNTSSGDYMHQVSWPLVAPFGRFIELKKTDAIDDGILRMEKFNECVSFIPIDMLRVCLNKPSVMRDLLKAVGQLYRSGQINPLPVTSFPISQIDKAYTEFSRFHHTGKLVLTYGDNDLVPFVPSIKEPIFLPNAAYLVVGGLRGFGSYVSKWMVRKGARNIVFLARSALDGEAQEIVDTLRLMGATVYVVQGSVSVREDVKRALTISELPIRGIINSALVLHIKPMSQLAVDEIKESFEPKVQGSIVLHEVSIELQCQLDFFLMLSSLVSIAPIAVQSAYASASCYMDEFARYRRKLGFVATCVNIGIVGDIGFAARNQESIAHLARNGHYVTSAHEVMALVARVIFQKDAAGHKDIRRACTALCTEPARLREVVDSGAAVHPPWTFDKRWEIIGTHAMRVGRGGSGPSRAHNAKGDVKDMVVERLAKLLWVPAQSLSLEATLSGLGIDSMIASEFRHWMYQTFKKNMSMLEILSSDMTVSRLCQLLVEESQG